jgi:hypothetical protein
MRLARHIERMEMYTTFWLENLMEWNLLRCRSAFEDNIKINFRNMNCGVDSAGSRQYPLAGLSESSAIVDFLV